jgi:hypothetical protein
LLGRSLLRPAVPIAGWCAEQSWFPGVAFLAGIGLVVGLNVLNPDAYVAQYNIESRSTSGLDPHALGSLGVDERALSTS